MKKMMWLPVALLTSAALFVGCQKQLESELEAEQSKIGRSVSKFASAETCDECIPRVEVGSEQGQWELTYDSIVYPEVGLNTKLWLAIEHDENSINYMHLSAPLDDGSFTHLAYEVIFYDVSAGTTTTLLSQDDENAPGSVNDRDLFKDNEGVDLLDPPGDLPLPEGWEGCDYIEVKLTEVGGVGFGTKGPISVFYYLRELCPLCVAYDPQTAYGGETLGDNSDGNNGWYYLFDVSGPATQTIYASQTKVAGSITWTGTGFEISLNSGWELNVEKSPDAEDAVKIQGFTIPPTARPTPGQSDIKTDMLSIDLTNYLFPLYAVHLDVKECLTSLPE